MIVFTRLWLTTGKSQAARHPQVNEQKPRSRSINRYLPRRRTPRHSKPTNDSAGSPRPTKRLPKRTARIRAPAKIPSAKLRRVTSTSGNSRPAPRRAKRQTCGLLWFDGAYSSLSNDPRGCCPVLRATAFGGAQANPPASPTSNTPSPPPSNAKLDGNLFYEILLGEVTTRTGDRGWLCSDSDAARRSRSEQLYQRAADIALQSRSGEYALAAAKAWQEDHPQSREANRYVLQILIALNKVGETAGPLRQFIEQAPLPNRGGILSAVPQMYGRIADKAAAVSAVKEAFKGELENRSTGAAAWIHLGTPATCRR